MGPRRSALIQSSSVAQLLMATAVVLLKVERATDFRRRQHVIQTLITNF